MDEPVNTNYRQLLVKKQTVFSKLSDTEIADLAALFVEKAYKAGDTIVTEGDPVDSFFLIVRGIADVQHITLKDHVFYAESVAELHAGQAIGINESGFYSLTGRRTATVLAKTDMVLLQLSLPRFHGFALAYPNVNRAMRRNAPDIDSVDAE
ncbi:MAG: cyclic nucleotide-binding domain-containing protein [Gammaproteobacteria bacterium]|nr:cyclic nucleotide-binding domain-containing protein [Gammaproteobacteria bacterium]